MTASGDFFSALIRAYDLVGSHPPHHPSVRVALAEAGTKLEACEIAVAEVGTGGLSVEGSALPTAGAGPSALASALDRAGVTRVRVLPEAGAETVEALVRAVSATEGDGQDTGVRLRALEAPGLELTFRETVGLGVPGQPDRPHADEQSAGPAEARSPRSGPKSTDTSSEPEPSGAAADEPVADPRLARAAAALFGDGGSVAQEGDEANERQSRERPVADAGLEGAVDAYATLRDEGLGDIIFETVAALRSEEELGRALNAMATLVEGADQGPDDPRLELVRRLGRSEVRDHLVWALAVCETDRLERLTGVAVALGSTMGPALGQALADASDQAHRERYVGALKRLGGDAVEAVEDLIGDARWFVVRNGVHLIPDVAGGRAVEHLAGALGHHDPRVRCEAARGLTRVAGDRAVRLLLSALDDPDDAVRSAAASGLGVVGGREVVPALLDRLGVESDGGVQIDLVRSLGQIGDARAVASLKRRATAGSFLAGTTDIRLAALRALWAVGTPEARAVVMQALEDRDPDVRGVVRTLLGGH